MADPYSTNAGFPIQSGGGCSSGGCSNTYSGYQTLPAQSAYGMQTSRMGCGAGGCGDTAGDAMTAITLPAPIKFEEEEQADGSGEEE